MDCPESSFKKLVIVGAGKIAEVAYRCFSTDGHREVVAFCVEDEFRDANVYLGLPLIPISELKNSFPPESFDVFVAVGYQEINELRARLFSHCKDLGYSFGSYCSPASWRDESFLVPNNFFLMASSVVQPGATVEDNVFIFSGVTIGHHSRIRSHAWLASGVAIGGSVNLERNCFLGMNASIAHEVRIGQRSLIGAGAVITRDVDRNSVVIQKESDTIRLDIDRFLKLTKME